ncbi:MAG: hypothetical protein U9Q75_03115 [Pseudomonadota bacterium]|nr:hypothetical protein [Pseudomonadota bacterium]
MLDDRSQFAPTVEKLLLGEVICEARTPELFQFLANAANEDDVNAYLSRIDRVLRRTSDQLAWFAAYKDIEAQSARSCISRQFSEVINDLEPLVRWLSMTTILNGSGASLQAGDEIRSSDLIRSIESAPALCEELEQISRYGLFKNAQSQPKRQLDAVLHRLVERGYLVTTGRSRAKYIATGLWSRLYDLMSFIQAHEQIALEEGEDAAQQDELQI